MANAKPNIMLTDPNTKPTGGPTLQSKTDRVIGTRFYPPSDSDNFCTLFVKEKNIVCKQYHKK
eukprot:3195215-Ditylum_brightwellii.AAC.1